jgi:hypothetical protein
MFRTFATAVAGLILFTAGLRAQVGIQRGTDKQIDAEKGILTITVDGQDREFLVADTTQVFGASKGPAEFELLATDRGFCHYGKLRAKLSPQSRGFMVSTAS